jgi:hypothetical protein
MRELKHLKFDGSHVEQSMVLTNVQPTYPRGDGTFEVKATMGCTVEPMFGLQWRGQLEAYPTIPTGTVEIFAWDSHRIIKETPAN